MNWQTVLTAMLPENLLLLGIVALLVLEIVDSKSRGAFALAVATATAAAAAALWLHLDGYAAAPFPGHYSVAPGSTLAQFLLISLTLPPLLLSREQFRSSSYYTLLLASVYGACMLPASDSFATLFLGIELMSLPVYVLVLLGFQRPGCSEAALKYLVLGGTATATLLFGISLLYGGSGWLSLDTFGIALASGDPFALTGVALVVAALLLKAAIVPLHAWAPDAYEAASVPVTAYMATVIKAGVLLAALRLFGSAPVEAPILGLVAILPLASMIWGNLAAIRQTSFRRMIAYSSIAHAGYLYFVFLGAGPGRYQALLFYLAAYGAMTLLAFTALPRASGDGSKAGEDTSLDQLQSLEGLFHRRPVAALAIAAAMLSLAGLPPLPGFIAKFLVFRNVLAAGHTGWAVLGLLASYLGLYFYLRVIQYMFMRSPAAAAQAGRLPRFAWIAGAACAAAALALAVLPGWLIDRL
jgi:NADH-quinone oxidoreductase subunit N